MSNPLTWTYFCYDAATLKLNVTRHWRAYIRKGCQPHPTNWKINKCNDYLLSHPIPTLEKADLELLQSELGKWKGIQEMINVTEFYPSPKSFWSCTHVNSSQKYILYINLHILLNILSKATLISKDQENPSNP